MCGPDEDDIEHTSFEASLEQAEFEEAAARYGQSFSPFVDEEETDED